MKRITITIAFLLITICFGACAKKDSRHVGEWVSMEKADPMHIIMDESNHLTFTDENGKPMRAPDWKKMECSYEIDYTKDPVWLDIIFKMDGKEAKWKGIVQFLDGGTMVYKSTMSFSGKRADNFESDDSYLITFNKVK